MTGKVPYAGLNDFQVLRPVLEGNKPTAPADIDNWTVAETCLYELYHEQCCIKPPASRSKAADLITSIAEIRIICDTNRPTNEVPVASVETRDIASMNHLHSSLQNLDENLDLTKLMPTTVSMFKTYGGCSDVWFGHMRNGKQVAAKRIRVSSSRANEEKLVKVEDHSFQAWTIRF